MPAAFAELVLAAALLQGAPEPVADFSMPGELAQAFSIADRSLQHIVNCLGDEGALASDAFAVRDQRLLALQARAASAWGNRTFDYTDELDDTQCPSGNVPAALARGDRDMDQLEAMLGKYLAPLDKGIWIGAMPLCDGRLTRTEILEDEMTGDAVLRLTFDARGGADLARLTKANVNNRLAIRADGAIVVEPNVHEPIVGGQIQIAGADRAELERLTAILAQCTAGVRTAG